MKLRCENLVKKYGHRTVVKGVSMEVNQGEILVNGQLITNMTSSQLTRFRRQELGFVFQQYNLMPNKSNQTGVSSTFSLNTFF